MKLLTFNWFVLHKWQFPTVQLNICAIIPILQVRKLRLLLAVWLIQGFLVNDRTVTAFLTLIQTLSVLPTSFLPWGYQEMHSPLENVLPEIWKLDREGGRSKGDSGESPGQMPHCEPAGCGAKEGGFQEGTHRSFGHRQDLALWWVSIRTNTIILYRSKMKRPKPGCQCPWTPQSPPPVS